MVNKNACKERVMRYLLPGFIISLLFTMGCTAVISEQSRKLVNTDAAFKTVREAPENFIGKHIMIGGRIANIRNSSDGAQLEIVQFELTSSGLPEDSFLSYGRFLAINSDYMDPMIFKRGMLITLVGELKGKKTLRLDDMDYTYPLIAIREWHLWRGSEAHSGYSYPIRPPEYNPYNYGYGYEPFLQRPFNQVNPPR